MQLRSHIFDSLKLSCFARLCFSDFMFFFRPFTFYPIFWEISKNITIFKIHIDISICQCILLILIWYRYINITIKKTSFKKCVILADRERSDRVGISIIIYFYGFNLTECGPEIVLSRDYMADHATVYRPLTWIAFLVLKNIKVVSLKSDRSRYGIYFQTRYNQPVVKRMQNTYPDNLGKGVQAA